MRYLLLCLLSWSWVSAADLELVVNPTVSVTTVDRHELVEIYCGHMTSWPNGGAITPIFNRSDVHGEFLSKYMGKTEGQFMAAWKRLVFAGKTPMPESFTSDAEVMAKVKKTPGAIGYVAKGSTSDGVVIIPVK